MNLLARHRKYRKNHISNFKGLDLIIHSDVFDPSLTNVSDILADEIMINQGDIVLDMFTGSGALGFLAAKKASCVIGVDLSKQAITCAKENAIRLGLENKTEFRLGYLWSAISEFERFNTIIANPPLLPVYPEDTLEMAIADSPDMTLTIDFLGGCASHLKRNGRVFMTFSNACSVFVGDPEEFIKKIAINCGFEIKIKATKEVGYEKYRVLEFRN